MRLIKARRSPQKSKDTLIHYVGTLHNEKVSCIGYDLDVCVWHDSPNASGGELRFVADFLVTKQQVYGGGDSCQLRIREHFWINLEPRFQTRGSYNQLLQHRMVGAKPILKNPVHDSVYGRAARE